MIVDCDSRVTSFVIATHDHCGNTSGVFVWIVQVPLIARSTSITTDPPLI